MRKRRARRRNERRGRVRPEDSSTPASGDVVTPQRLLHDEFDDLIISHSAYESVTVKVCRTQRKIDRYYRRGQIAEHQWQAGSRLYADFYAFGLSPRTTVNLMNEVHGNGGADSSMANREDARTRYNAAIKSIPAGIRAHAENVICFDIAATQASMYETARQAIDNGMRDLRLALDALARHYGIAETGQSA